MASNSPKDINKPPPPASKPGKRPKKGQRTKGSGRQPGKRNQVSLDIRDRMEAVTGGVPIPVLLAQIGYAAMGRAEDLYAGTKAEAKEAQAETQIAIKSLGDASKYGYHQLKAVEHSGSVEAPSFNVILSNS